MSRRSRIRWNKSDEKELARLVKNYNAKINRILKKDPQMKEYLPERARKNELKARIETRSELKKEMNSLKRFLKRGSEELVFNDFEGKERLGITKYEKREIEIQVATINRLKSIRRKEIEEMDVKSRGKNVGYKNREMERMEKLQLLQPKIFNFKKKKKSDYEHFKKGLKNDVDYITMKDLILRDNYIDSLYEHLGNNNYVDEIAKTIEGMPLDKFIGKYYSDKEAIIEFIYDPIQAKTKLEELYKVWGLTDDDLFEITDTEGISENYTSQIYEIYDKDGRVLKRVGTERGAKRFMDKTFGAIEYKYIGVYSPKKRNRKKR